MQPFVFDTTTSIICEVGASLKLADYFKSLSVDRLMLVTDPGIINAGLGTPIINALKKAGIGVELYTDVQADPPEHVVLECAQTAKSARINGVLGLGGGSSMDVAKLVAALTASEQPLSQMYGIGNVSGGRLPLIQIPTTAGTGSEVTPIAIVTTGETTKTGVVSKQLLPDYAILDAQLTLGLPPAITAATGVDAMVHAIEAYTSKHKKNIYSDTLAQQALRLLSSNIRDAVHNGGNLETRANMLVGSLMAGQAFANAPVAAVHALAYPLGGHFHIPHGLSNSLVLPHVLQFNAADASEYYSQLLPCITNTDTAASSASDRTQQFIDEMNALIKDVELPRTLREMNIAESDLNMLAEDAMLQQRLLVNNPRDVTYEDALAIYQAAF